ncbi:hypothetical protein DR950_40765 [Kitasatospora xanthocidica]|uniref:DUF6542 domain-containing protein n=1 Tax=Kitasatospora xanthocidica TaxID=83382 RepID=A0A372ZIS6_9ACTN|nr:DUF6542 domain-containing protein [Kitasatospora xanthocidica]RGD55671.1 hypothetical protein DR950_40765 [Kitasatospora xanthocidica]
MAGQRARTPYQDTGPRTEDRALPAQRSWPAGAGAAGAPGRRADTAAPRQVRSPLPGAARRRQQARRRGGTAAAFSAVGLPLLGAVADELDGPGVGLLFAVGSVLGTAAAALLCSRTGRWWVVTAAPVVVLLTASGVEYLAHPGKYQGRNLGTGALRWVVGAFPVMAAAVAVALVVVAVRVTAARRRAVPERRRTGRTAVPAGRGRRG